MWFRLAKFILRYKIILLSILIIATVGIGFFAAKIQIGYDFAKAIPLDNPKYEQYLAFKKKFGDDGNTMVIGISSDKFYSPQIFNAWSTLEDSLKTVPGVIGVLAIPSSANLIRNDAADQFRFEKIFRPPYVSQDSLQKDKDRFLNLPFYNGLLYNLATDATLMAVRLNSDSANSKARTSLIGSIEKLADNFASQSKIDVHLSGLPFIRTVVSDRIQKEMYWFLIGSIFLSAITLLAFFRSFGAMAMSLLVVSMGVIWSMGTMVLLGYKITLLTALIPPLIVVIGIPNCIYFLNKYHMAFKEEGSKEKALEVMIGKMGVVTLFCNIAAAIGFAVFALTQSALLKEFGIVSGINIMMLFIISLIFIPAVLSFLPAPKKHQTRYLDNRLLDRFLGWIERTTFTHSKAILIITALIVTASIIGITRLQSEGYIVDDLPKSDKIYTDLKWFEKNFDGIMPLEIVVDTKRKNGLFRSLGPIEDIDMFQQYIKSRPETSKPLSFVNGLKFAKQAYYDGDSVNYTTPTEFDMPLLGKYLKQNNSDTTSVAASPLNQMLNSFIDKDKEEARISVNMKDIGSAKLPVLLHEFDSVANTIFDTSKYTITFTGTSVTFLEGTRFIINGLKDSIFWAFILIALTMLYLFKSFRILLCSLIPNVVPLIITAGIMGWVGIALKPSTVLIFSVALGIVIDVTIRFLVNYKQELPNFNYSVDDTLKQTIRHTGISIIYTSLVLVAGFVIFVFSHFGGTKALGWLTSLTLLTGTLTNLLLLPVLLKIFAKKKR